MRDLAHMNNFRYEYLGRMSDGENGLFKFPIGAEEIRVIASDGLGWDHVSVSLEHRCPTWDEMCIVKDLFFHESEWVVQFHPAKADYVNCHPFCLHMWRHQTIEFPKPASQMVGPKSQGAA